MIPTMICSAQEQVWDQLKQVSISDDELRQSMDQFLLQAKEEIIGKDNI